MSSSSDADTPAAASALGALPRGTPDVVERVIQRVAELPDRTSPDDWPDAMLVTADELAVILSEELAAHLDALQTALDAERTTLDRAKKELAKALSPDNQNVKNGDLIAMARDLAQVKVTALDNYRELEKQFDAERTTQQAALRSLVDDLRGNAAVRREGTSNVLANRLAEQEELIAARLEAALQARRGPQETDPT